MLKLSCRCDSDASEPRVLVGSVRVLDAPGLDCAEETLQSAQVSVPPYPLELGRTSLYSLASPAGAWMRVMIRLRVPRLLRAAAEHRTGAPDWDGRRRGADGRFKLNVGPGVLMKRHL